MSEEKNDAFLNAIQVTLERHRRAGCRIVEVLPAHWTGCCVCATRHGKLMTAFLTWHCPERRLLCWGLGRLCTGCNENPQSARWVVKRLVVAFCYQNPN